MTAIPMIGQQWSGWQPTPDVTDHNGEAIEPGRVFFAPPPAEIGPVISAHSSLKPNEDGISIGVRLLVALGIFVGCIVAGFVAGSFMHRRNFGLMESIGIAVGSVVCVVVLIKWRFRRTCSYVGVGGAAQFTITGSRNAQPTVNWFAFPMASELRTQQTRQFVNGIYSGTDYSFKWTNATGQIVFQLGGNYHSKEGRPKRSSPFWFARAAEISWNQYQLQWVAQQVETMGFAHFNLTGGNFVRVGPGFFEFGMKGEIARIAVEEIKSLNLNQGQFHITHKDARWFSSKGKFNFSYASMANAQLFLLAMEKLTGYRFE